MLQKVKGQIITAGYDWAIQLSFAKSPITFPETAKFVAQIRRSRDDENVLATLSTDNGNIVRLSVNTLQLRLPGALSEGWPDRQAHIDIVRVDGDLRQHLGVMLVVPVRRPITRGL